MADAYKLLVQGVAEALHGAAEHGEPMCLKCMLVARIATNNLLRQLPEVLGPHTTLDLLPAEVSEENN